ncbi:putative transporter [Escovopsis weberi]|uniref:Putative transporter n=1 Tax=Escovopsis weberi TaxID=150374 RepID=A0A0M9VVU5_ESCWE|nr:putative transporter [Escovopsis weberi]
MHSLHRGDESTSSSSPAQRGAHFTPDDGSDDDVFSHSHHDDDPTRHLNAAGTDSYELVTKRDSWRTTGRDRPPRKGGGGGGGRLHHHGHGPYDAVANADHDADEQEDHLDGLDAADARTTRTDGRSTLSVSTVEDYQLYTKEEELAVRTKFDRKLVLFVALLYMLSFLDRSNIGNARIAGMDEDLQSDPPRDYYYHWALMAFYIPYIAFEWMSFLWRIIPAHVFVSVVVFTWGLMASLQAIAVSYPMLIALRVVMGIGEAGFTGIPFYLSFFYKRRELAFRTAIFISAAPLATSFASSLAWVIVRLAEFGPIAPWRLLFLIEGFPSVVVAVLAWSIIPDSPQTAPYLSKREKKVAILRLRHERPSSSRNPRKHRQHRAAHPLSHARHAPEASKLHALLAVLRDPVSWLTPAMLFLANMAYSSLPVFLPKIVSDMGHGRLASQALCIPPYLLAFLVVLFTAHMSDRLGARTTPVVFHAAASAAGYALLALAQPLALPPWLRYLAVYPAAVGFFNVVTLVIAWNINNQSAEGRQGGAFALLQLVGQCGPLVGTSIYPDADAPYYTRGMAACAAAMAAVALLALLLRAYLRHRNARMDKEARRSEDGGAREEEGLVRETKRKQGEPFRYML